MFEESRVVQGLQTPTGLKQVKLDVATVIERRDEYGDSAAADKAKALELRKELGQDDSVLLDGTKLVAMLLTEGEQRCTAFGIVHIGLCRLNSTRGRGGGCSGWARLGTQKAT